MSDAMQCKTVWKTASRVIDRVASAAEAEALAAHVATCEPCRLEVEALSRAWAALAPLEKVASPPDDWVRIAEAVEERRRRWTFPWLRWVPATFSPAAAMTLLAMVALGTTGGALLSRAALAPPRTVSIEATAFAETLGDLPWASPATGLSGSLLAAPHAAEAR